MRYFEDIKQEQADAVSRFRKMAEVFVLDRFVPCDKISGVLLSGSVSRGDARIDPKGIFIDIAVVVENISNINLDELVGPDTKPFIPYHCIPLDDQVGFAIEVIEQHSLQNIRKQHESIIFARNESEILFDRDGMLEEWKRTAFTITSEDIRSRAVQRKFRINYLTGEYRFEKWSRREAWIQINQNFNEACECYCEFLYCINGSFIPRKDWLVYLTYGFPEKPERHTELLEQAYTAANTEAAVLERNAALQEMAAWVNGYCENMGWLKK